MAPKISVTLKPDLAEVSINNKPFSSE